MAKLLANGKPRLLDMTIFFGRSAMQNAPFFSLTWNQVLMKQALNLVALPLLALSILGCGGNNLPEGVKFGTVEGVVTAKGKALPEGCLVSFYPEGGPGLPAAASLAADGSFQLRSKGSFDIPTGIYKIVILPPPPPVMSDEEAMQASVSGTMPTNDVKQIATKYRAVDSTTETFEVKEGENQATIDLKD